MKFSALLCLVVLCACPSLDGQPIAVSSLTGPDGRVEDTEYGLAFTCPDGWKVQGAWRWGDFQTTYTLHRPETPEAQASVYFQGYYAPFEPPGGPAAWLRQEAARKAASRARETNLVGYTNREDSFIESTIQGNPALTWVANYTQDGQACHEILTRIVAPTGNALFFTHVSADQFESARRGHEVLAASTQFTQGALVQRLDPRLLEARKLQSAKDHAGALPLFRQTLQAEGTRPSDLVAGACAAAQLGEHELALAWVERAVALDPTQRNFVRSKADLAPLRDTATWKQLIGAARPTAGAETVTDPQLQQLLLAIHDEDQKYRKQLGAAEKQYGRNSPEILDLWEKIKVSDAANLAKVEEIIAKHGWVGPETVGQRANQALFLVIQHADHATQLKYLPLMRDAVKAGKAQASMLALLEDRIALRDGRAQTYGSQIGTDSATGAHYVMLLEDPDHVDERRAAVGLQPLADYVRSYGITWDVEAFKKEQAERLAAAPPP